MTSKEALENITDWIEYFTRLDYVEPIVRGEVQKNFYEAYHKTRPELELIKKDLEKLEQYEKIFNTPIMEIKELYNIINDKIKTTNNFYNKMIKEEAKGKEVTATRLIAQGMLKAYEEIKGVIENDNK